MPNVQMINFGNQLGNADLQAQQLELQRRQQVVDALRQQSLAPIQQQQVSGRVVPISPFEGIMKLASAYLGNKSQDVLNQQQAQLGTAAAQRYADALRQMSPDSQSQAIPAASGASSAQTVTNPFVDPSAVQLGDQPQASSAAPTQPTQAVPQQGPNINRAAMAAFLMGNTELGNKLLEQQWAAYAPTDATKMATAGGMDTREANRQALAKANYIAPVSLRPGGVAAYADGRMEQLPTAIEGAQAVRNPDGTWSYRQNLGATEAIGAAEAAKLAGRNAQTLTPTDQLPVDAQGRPIPQTIGSTIAAATGAAPVNNPGNLRPVGASTGFRQFASPQEGLAALDADLQAKGKRGLNTVSSIISVYAPPGDKNNTGAYISDVSRRLGIKPDQPLDMSSPMVRQALSTAIMLHEQGPQALAQPQAQQPPARQGVGLPLGAKTSAEASATNQQSLMKDDYSGLSAQNSNAQTTIARLQTIKDLGAKAITGGMTEKRDYLNGILALAGMKSATDAKTASDLIDKNASQIATSLGMGPNGSDQLRQMLQAAYPGRHMTVQAMNEAVDALVPQLQMTQAKAALLTPHFSGGDAGQYLQKKQIFDQAADPRIWQWMNIRDPAQKKAFAQQVMAQDPTFPDKIKMLDSIGALK